MMELIRQIKHRGHHVTFIPDNMAVFSPYLEQPASQGVEVVYPPYFGSVEEYLKQHGREFNLAIISRADVADRHIETVRRNAPRARIVFDTVDLCFVREERQASVGDNPALRALAANRKAQELRLAGMADATLVVSPFEKAMLESECGSQIDVRIVPNIYPVANDDPPGWHDRRDIVFIGASAPRPQR